MSNSIIPYLGFGDFLLYQSEEEAKNIIKCSKWSFSAEVWDNKECTRPVPWKIIRVSNFAELFFANDKLFRIGLATPCSTVLQIIMCFAVYIHFKRTAAVSKTEQ